MVMIIIIVMRRGEAGEEESHPSSSSSSSSKGCRSNSNNNKFETKGTMEICKNMKKVANTLSFSAFKILCLFLNII